MAKVRIYYSEYANLIRVLHPDGLVEMLCLDVEEQNRWEWSVCSAESYDEARKKIEVVLASTTEFIGEL